MLVELGKQRDLVYYHDTSFEYKCIILYKIDKYLILE